MLDQNEINAVLTIISKHHDKQSASVEAMNLVQKQYGWVSDEHLEHLSELLELTPVELDSLATFYNYIYRRPVGRHVISICDSISCWIMGYDKIRRYLETRLGIQPGQTTRDGRFTLLPEPCLGACDQAPAMLIDGRLIGNLTEEKIDQILARCT